MPLEADFVRHLSDDSRYMRFMSTIRELPPVKLKYLVDVDHVRHVALVAVTEAEGKPVEVGVVRYIVDPNGQDCEFSVAIDDAWHHTGLAGILMAALMDVARKRGLARMEGIVLAERIAGQHVAPINYDHVPRCTYCEPEIGSVGLTESQAKDREDLFARRAWAT